MVLDLFRGRPEITLALLDKPVPLPASLYVNFRLIPPLYLSCVSLNRAILQTFMMELESACSYTFTYAEHLFDFSILTLQQLVVRAKFCVFGDKASP